MALFGSKRPAAEPDTDKRCTNCGGPVIVQMIDLVRATELVHCPTCGERGDRALTPRTLAEA